MALVKSGANPSLVNSSGEAISRMASVAIAMSITAPGGSRACTLLPSSRGNRCSPRSGCAGATSSDDLPLVVPTCKLKDGTAAECTPREQMAFLGLVPDDLRNLWPHDWSL